MVAPYQERINTRMTRTSVALRTLCGGRDQACVRRPSFKRVTSFQHAMIPMGNIGLHENTSGGNEGETDRAELSERYEDVSCQERSK